MLDRTILHCDLNGFYASVECLLRPELKGIPMAVCGDPQSRHGIILAKNELAKRTGVATAETIWQAKRKCPNLTLVPPHREEYLKWSRVVNGIYARFTDRVEPFGIDESWLDITHTMHLFGTGQEVADRIRNTIRTETGLTASVGVSFNKVFAKLGSDYKKPDATTVIDREHFREIVWPLPVQAMLYVGRSAAATLLKYGVHTIGDLAACDRGLLSARMGKLGETLYDYANGLDEAPVRLTTDEEEAKSVGNGMTFRRNLLGMDDVKTGLHPLCDEVAMRLRKYGCKCSTVALTIKDPALKSISRQRTLAVPTQLAHDLFEITCEIVREEWRLDKPIRMLTVTASHLTPQDAAEQLSFFDGGTGGSRRREKLEQALDGIRGKYGLQAVEAGRILKNDLGIGQEKHEEDDE